MKNFKELISKVQAANQKLERADKRKKKLRMTADPNTLNTGGYWWIPSWF